jgi:tetratricopeptide (TPR) repeat protein
LWPLSVPFAALLFLVGAASKESALALPVLLVLYDWLLAPSASWLRRAVPYLAYGIAAAAWLAVTLPNLDTLQSIAYIDNPLAYMPAWERIPRAAALLWHYFGLVLLPLSTKPDRSFATVNPSLLEGVVGTLAWLVVLAACWRARKSDPLAVFLTLWLPAAFAVTANILYPIGVIMAERLVFAPSAGVLLLVGLVFDRITANAPLRRRAIGALGGVAALLLAFAYDARARVWASDSHYHFVAAIESPSSAKAHYNLGLERAAAEDFTAAEAAFRRALEIYPKFDLAAYYLAGVLIQTDRPEEAIEVYKAYLALAPGDAGALSQLVTLELGADRYEDARASAQRLVALDPQNLGHQGLLDTVEMMMTARNRPVGPSVLEGELERWQPKAPH